MNGPELARLPDVERLLSNAGYAIGHAELAEVPALIAESPYALIACAEFDDWEALEERIFDVQSALTRVAARAPSARNWDLYVLALVIAEGRDAAHRAIAEAIEGDTRYARKFVRVHVRRGGLERALRPLLPLALAADLEIGNPFEELREELRSLEVDDADADAAVESFRRNQVVEVR